MKNNINQAYFAGGCFWGVEYHFQSLPGVLSTTVGYMGGHTDNPSYEQVCAKGTGHAEVLQVSFDDSIVSYQELAKLFFEIHDPTQVNRQGPDIGDQYRSAIFYTNPQQKEIAEKLIDILKHKGFKVATRLYPAPAFYPAEKYHQHYYTKNNAQPYCHIRRKIF